MSGGVWTPDFRSRTQHGRGVKAHVYGTSASCVRVGKVFLQFVLITLGPTPYTSNRSTLRYLSSEFSLTQNTQQVTENPSATHNNAYSARTAGIHADTSRYKCTVGALVTCASTGTGAGTGRAGTVVLMFFVRLVKLAHVILYGAAACISLLASPCSPMDTPRCWPKRTF